MSYTHAFTNMYIRYIPTKTLLAYANIYLNTA